MDGEPNCINQSCVFKFLKRSVDSVVVNEHSNSFPRAVKIFRSPRVISMCD